MKGIIKNSAKIVGIADKLPEHPYIFKQFSIERTLVLPESKPDISHLVEVNTKINILKKKMIKTPAISSLERQVLTGKYLSIEGNLIQKIEYAADVPTQVVHAAEFNIPFCTSIMLPKDYILDTSITITPYIEDLCSSLINQRTLFENIILLMDGSLYH
ncbi:MAG: DUF3794 domain-containing protein [Marinisporobacter sp.]|jgi:hypothetical protein|nr:DUF3794 domain-containing protein [Marinisporobacter sp.]